MHKNIDIRIKSVEPLATPAVLAAKLPVSEELEQSITSSRTIVNDIIKGRDCRLLAIVGPCSIHDPAAAFDYAKKLRALAEEVSEKMYIVMRTYFEKPRTIGGWKGLIIDPKMDGSCDIQSGISIARKLLIDITSLGMPVGCEMLDPIVPQYIDELLSWCAIGARTTESQTHRTLASGMSVAVGFKNSTSGELAPALNAIKSAMQSGAFIGVDKDGNTSIYRTTGNDCGHLILRGGDHAPNYYEEEVLQVVELMEKSGILPSILVDCSHANSRKDPKRQKRVLRAVIDQVVWGQKAIRGFMLESNLLAGCQRLDGELNTLQYGVSITDGCIGWEETESVIRNAFKTLKAGKSDF
ncbi:MAG: 3-deoxy-7-phosphoheptulonate synthase [Sphaerochaetaceae bacterium]|jgi:3-deoxy-7-phosphoheptulonate synthase|nr:3-deoxy-7-phosphoheptulonate synthase [Sphaerochaetaceae bacterium]MDX9809415.1 3-deoxy-7-phosphoheptulonate synthase [Sphaerochaetaceae bacterium]NLV85132.1 3-deoxy-7-phosphoheptulonate synthase [Spirochaetales bacterium]